MTTDPCKDTAPPGAMTIRAAALRIGWTEASVRNQLSNDPTRLPPTFVVGSRRFFVAADLEQWLADRTTEARAALDRKRAKAAHA